MRHYKVCTARMGLKKVLQGRQQQRQELLAQCF
jgi:hypothetical protein